MKRLLLILGLLFCARPCLGVASLVQAKNNFSAATVTTLAVTITTTTGNAIYVFEGQGTGTTNDAVPTDASNTYTLVPSSCATQGTAEGCWYRKTNATSVSSVSCNYSPTSVTATCIVAELNGTATASDIDTNVIGSNAGSTTITSGTYTTTLASDIILLGARVGANEGTWTAGGSFTIPANATNTRGGVEYWIPGAIQTSQTATMTISVSGSNENSLIAVKAAGGATCTPTLTLLGVGRCG